MIGSHCTKKRCFLQLQVQQLLSKISLELSTSGSGERHALSASLQTCDTPLDPFPSAKTLQGSSTIRRSHAPFGRLSGLLGRTPYSPSLFGSPRIPTPSPWPFDHLWARRHILIRLGRPYNCPTVSFLSCTIEVKRLSLHAFYRGIRPAESRGLSIRPPYGLSILLTAVHAPCARHHMHHPFPSPCPSPAPAVQGCMCQIISRLVASQFVLFRFMRLVRLLDLYIPLYTP